MSYLLRSPVLWLLFMSIAALGTGCSSTPDPKETGPQDFSSSDEQIFVSDTIEMSYDPNVIMKRAESFFDKESYAEAIVEYKHFLDLHQNHILAPYAQYKIGVSSFKQFRTVDRDPEPLKKAIAGFEKLLKEHPGSRYEAEAKETILTCKKQLVQRHLMVGEFYLKREAYLAAAHRYEKIIIEFPELDTTSEAMFHLAKTYQDLGIEEWTQDWLVALINRYPDSDYHSSAQNLLTSLQEEHPTLLAALPKTPALLDGVTLPASTDTDVSLPSNAAVFANAGILPAVSTPEAPTPSVVAKQTEPQPSCALGAWCDSQTVQSTQPKSNPEPLPTDPKTCKAGEWC